LPRLFGSLIALARFHIL